MTAEFTATLSQCLQRLQRIRLRREEQWRGFTHYRRCKRWCIYLRCGYAMFFLLFPLFWSKDPPHSSSLAGRELSLRSTEQWHVRSASLRRSLRQFLSDAHITTSEHIVRGNTSCLYWPQLVSLLSFHISWFTCLVGVNFHSEQR